MTDSKKDDMFIVLEKARDLSVDVVDFIQEHVAKGNPGATDEQMLIIKAALGISFTTLCKATNTPIHDVIDMVMTIYKNTEVIHDDE